MNEIAPKTKNQPQGSPLSAPGILQRKCACGNHTPTSGECGVCSKKKLNLQRRLVGSESEHLEVPAIVHEVMHSSGHSLNAEARAFMGPRFGYDFSNIRVHTDGKAAESARAMNALAYTVGHNIVFGTGQYAPITAAGRHLIAHELTHTIQQEGSVRLQRAAATSSEEMLNAAIDIVQQSLDGLIAPAIEGDERPISAEDQERAQNLRVALDNLLALKESGNEEEILLVTQPILAAARGQSPGVSTAAGVQRRAIVSDEEDPLEREAEAVARRISQGISADDLIQRGEGQCRIQTIQRQGGPAEATLVTAGVASGPPGWAILGGAAVLALIAGGIYLATRPRSTTSPRIERWTRTGRSGDCHTMMTACMLTSLADEPGSVFGQSRCLFCAEVCRREGGFWPSRAQTTSGAVRCDFWNFPSTE